ncbi:kinase-like protein [Marasmius fiardii PR-910]|nr:kinase-like protein [Marasmius fiardii PR-910]
MALKVVKQTYVSEVSEELKTHMRDVIGWRMLDHSNVVPFIGSFYFGANPREMCLISLWMESNLVEYLAKNHPQLQELYALVWDVACGVEYLHRSNVTHGNLKGRNILIRTEGKASRALIADFGLYMLYPRSTMSGHIRPTPWCAPEVLREGSFTQKSDIYAYGILCYEAFTRCVPFDGLSEDELYKVVVDQKQCPQRPPRVDESIPWEVLKRCWSQDPSSRPTAYEVIKDLEGILADYL